MRLSVWHIFGSSFLFIYLIKMTDVYLGIQTHDLKSRNELFGRHQPSWGS